MLSQWGKIMQQIFSITFVFLLTMSISLFSMSPSVSAAQNPQCEIFTSHRKRMSEVMQPKENTLNEQRIKNKYSIPQEQTNAAQKITSQRKENDKSRLEIYKKIEDKLKTKSEKEALKTYKTAVESAIVSYRNSLDAATLVFNNDFQATVVAHQTATNTALASLKAEYDSHTASMIAFCDKNGTTKANEAFKSGIVQYEQTYNTTALVTPRELEQKVAALQATKRQSDAAAKKELETAVKNAKNELQKTIKTTTKYIYD